MTLYSLKPLTYSVDMLFICSNSRDILNIEDGDVTMTKAEISNDSS